MAVHLSDLLTGALTVVLIAGLTSARTEAQTPGKPLQQNPSSESKPSTEPLVWSGILKSNRITESSGLARSAIIAGGFWTMNDSGNSTDVFLFGRLGNALARCELEGARNVDWEAMSTWQSGDENFIVVADTGDNFRKRSHYQIYFAKEPKGKPAAPKLYKKSAPAVGVRFKFESGAVNCEAMGVPPGTDEVFFVEKQFAETNMQHPPGIFRLPLPAKELKTRLDRKRKDRSGYLPKMLVASKVANLPCYGVTGMAFSPDGQRVAIRNYLEMRIFQNPPGPDDQAVTADWASIFQNQTAIVLPMPLQKQGEAICFSADSQSVLVTSETPHQPIWKINLHALRKQLLDEK